MSELIGESPASESASSPQTGSDSGPRKMLADPTVARIKFERQIEEYRDLEREYIRRGWYLLRATFPEVTVAFAAPHLSPPLVLLVVTLDFTDYDFLPPSVRFVDPFTLEPLPADRLPNLLPKRVTIRQLVPAAAFPPGMVADAGGGTDGMVEMQQIVQQPLVQHHAGKPFLCIAGVREYHEHPVHSNDPWLPHRSTGRGRLIQILEVIWRHGVLPVQIGFQITGIQLRPEIDPDKIPE